MKTTCLKKVPMTKGYAEAVMRAGTANVRGGRTRDCPSLLRDEVPMQDSVEYGTHKAGILKARYHFGW